METLTAPPINARTTTRTADVPASLISPPFRIRIEDTEPAVQCFAREQDDEDESLQKRDGRIRKVHAALDNSARRGDPPKEDSDGNDRERVLPGHEGDQDARKAIAGVKRRIGLALYRRDLEEAGEPRTGAADRGASNEEPANRQALRQAQPAYSRR